MGDEQSVRINRASHGRVQNQADRRAGPRRPAGHGGARSHALVEPEVLAAIIRAVQAEVERRPPLPRLLTQSEVIKALRTSKSAFHRLRTGQIAGALPFPKPRYVGAHPRWIAADVEVWIVESTVRPV